MDTHQNKVLRQKQNVICMRPFTTNISLFEDRVEGTYFFSRLDLYTHKNSAYTATPTQIFLMYQLN